VKKLAIVRIHSGLGNQLFQYSMGAYLQTLGYELLWDSSGFHYREIAERSFLLHSLISKHYNIPRWARAFMRALPSLRDECEHRVFEAPHQPLLYARGYWQHPYYAAYGRERIRAVLPQVPLSLSGICLCVRRTDYVAVAAEGGIHYPLDLTYYEKAVAQLPSNYPIHVFSDDIAWCKQNLPAIAPERQWNFIPEQITPWENLALMSSFDYHIIANSTFHWWGAYLSRSKQVIAPNPWLQTIPASRAIIPANWVSI
jgi:Glycosyl transferase family 11